MGAGTSIDLVEWILLYVLWAPVLGALLLRSVVVDPERRSRALRGYFYAALFLHPLALVPVLVSTDAALLVLAGFDGALLAIVLATWRDERALGAVLAEIDADPAQGARRARRWMRQLTARHAGSTRVEHALALARCLDRNGRGSEADAILEGIPRADMSPREAARVSVTLALFALGRGDAALARTRTARALGRAPATAPEVHTARALWSLLDAIEGLGRRAFANLARLPRALGSPVDRALVALARAHALSATGETAHARALVRGLDAEARPLAERWARACVGPATPAIAGAGSVESPYR